MAQIDQLLKFMVKKGASDLHFCTGTQPIIRLHGEMTAIGDSPELPGSAVEKALGEIMPDPNKVEFQEKNDTDFAYQIEGLARFRVNVFRDFKGVGAVFRVIPDEILTLEQLNLPEVAKKFCSLSKGLVLVTGPTGSGKSTTLAAMIDYINSERKEHVITIEDPIEFVHKNKNCLVNQREVRKHTNGFKEALRAALREDPDLVLVGEMRDLETTEIALETAETGHLVFGTLHTNTAISTVDRIINQFPADRQQQIRMMLADSLKGVISQTLLRKKDGKGRVAAYEILYVTPGIANNVREGKTHQIPSAIQTGKKFGMQILNDALTDLVKRDLVSAEEAYLKCVDKDGMANLLSTAGVKFEGKTTEIPNSP